MSRYHIVTVVGSLRRESFNHKLANAVVKLAPSELSFEPLRIDDLPLYNQDNDANQAEPVKRIKEKIAAAQGVIFFCPEYNRGIPGVLKNAIDNASRPYGKNAWAGKPAGVLGVSIGAIGTALAQHQLRNVLAYLDMPTLGQPEVYLQMKDGLFDQAGNVGEGSRKFLQAWMDGYVDWVKRHTA